MRTFFGLRGLSAAAARGAAALTIISLANAPSGAAAQNAVSGAEQFGLEALAALRAADQAAQDARARAVAVQDARAAVERSLSGVVTAYYETRPDYAAAYESALQGRIEERVRSVRALSAQAALNEVIAESAAAEAGASQDAPFDAAAATARLLLAERLAEEFARLGQSQHALQAQFVAISGRRALALYATSEPADAGVLGALSAEAERPLESDGLSAYPVQEGDALTPDAPALAQAVEAAIGDAEPELEREPEPEPEPEPDQADPEPFESPSRAPEASPISAVAAAPPVVAPSALAPESVEVSRAPRVSERARAPAPPPPRLRAGRRPLRPAPVSGRLAPAPPQNAPQQAPAAETRFVATVAPPARVVAPVSRRAPVSASAPVSGRVTQRFAAAPPAPQVAQSAPFTSPRASFGPSPRPAAPTLQPTVAAPAPVRSAAPIRSTDPIRSATTSPFVVSPPTSAPSLGAPSARAPFGVAAAAPEPSPALVQPRVDSRATTPFTISPPQQAAALSPTPIAAPVATPAPAPAASTSAASATVRTAPSLDALVDRYRRLIQDSEQAQVRVGAGLPLDLDAAQTRVDTARELSAAFSNLEQYSLQNQASLLRETEERRIAAVLGQSLGVISEERDPPVETPSFTQPSFTPSAPSVSPAPFTIDPPQPFSIDRGEPTAAPENVVFSGPPVETPNTAEPALEPNAASAPAPANERPAAADADDFVERRLQIEASRRAEQQASDGVAVVMAAAAAPGEGPRLTEGELRGVLAKLSDCWSLPPERSTGLAGAMASIGVTLDEQGRVEPASVRVLSSNAPQGGSIEPVLEAARRMLANPSCQPFNLPAAKRDSWRRMVITLQMRAQT